MTADEEDLMWFWIVVVGFITFSVVFLVSLYI